MKENFGRWLTLLHQSLKRDYKKIIVWLLGLGLFAAGLIPAFEALMQGEGALGMYEVLQNPAMIAIVGPTPAQSASAYTLGAMYAHEMLLFCVLIAMTISILHVIHHTRKAEDLNLTELIRAFQVGRQANSLAIFIENVLINVFLAVVITLILISFQADSITLSGSVLFGLAIGGGGILGGAIALVMAQIMPSSSSATGASFAIMGLLYVARGVSDVSNLKLSTLNPLAWTYLTYPFVENNWLFIGLVLVLSFALVGIAFVLEGKRDMGAGYLPQQEGRARAKTSLVSVFGLFSRLNQGLIVSWFVALAVLGAAYGAIYGDMGSFLESNELMKVMFTAVGFSLEASFTSTVMMVMIGLVGILPIVIVNRLFNQEKDLYLSQIFGTKIKRSQLYWTNISLAILAGVGGTLLAAGGLGGAAISVIKNDNIVFSDFLAAGFNLFPTILFFIGLSGLILGWLPKLGKLVYVYLTYAFFLNYFQVMLRLPDWIVYTSPQSWLPNMPIETFSLLHFSVVLIISVLLMVVGYLGYRSRDLVEGA